MHLLPIHSTQYLLSVCFRQALLAWELARECQHAQWECLCDAGQNTSSPCVALQPRDTALPPLLLSRFSRPRATPQTAAHPVPRPGDSPGKNTAGGCHVLLQCMKVESESEVAQSRPAPSNPMDCSPPGSSVHGVFQARVLGWGAIAFSRKEH